MVPTLTEDVSIFFSALQVSPSPASLQSDSEEMKSERGGSAGTGSR